MAFTLVSTQMIIARNAGALYGLEVGNANMTSYATAAGSNVDAFLNTVYNNSVGSASTTSVATVLVANLGITGDAATAATNYIVGQLNAVAVSARGAAINSMLSAFANMTSDATFGSYATAWNTQVSNAVAYASVSGNGDASWSNASNTTTAGQTFTLTTGVDTVTGTAGNDTINAPTTGSTATNTLSALDSIDGGAGTDTLNVTDSVTASNAAFALPAGISIKNVEKFVATTSGSFGNTAGPTVFDLSTSSTAGFTDVTLASAGSLGSDVKVASTSNLTITNTGAVLTTSGGKSINATQKGTDVSITGTALTDVTLNASGATAASTITIDNKNAAGTSGAGTTLTTATLTSVDSSSAVDGTAIGTLNISGATTASRTVTITNSTVAHSLTVNATGTGYDSLGTTENKTVVTDTVAKNVTITSNTAKNSVDVSNNTAMTALTITGSTSLKAYAGVASLVSIDGSAATGNLNLQTLNAATTSVKGGAGNDAFTLAATTAVTVDAGAGNDTVTLASAIATGSSIKLGDGNDVLAFATGGSVATSTTTVIDGGVGTDTLSSSLLNGANSTQFTGFEYLGLDETAGTYDTTLLSGATGYALTGAATNATFSSASKSIGLHVLANGATSTALSFSGVTGLSDAYTINFEGTGASTATAAAPTTVGAGIVSVSGIEALMIAAGGTGYTNDTITVTDRNLRTLTVTGSSTKSSVAFSANTGSPAATSSDSNDGVSSIDASAYTGKLTVALTNVTANAAGISVLGGSGADTFTTIAAQSAALTGNGGADNFIVSSTVYGASAYKVNIKDFSAGDTITLADKGTETWTAAKASIGAATSLATALGNVIGTADGSTDGATQWFQYGGNTYIVECMTDMRLGAGTDASATDLVVKLTGLIDLSNASFVANAGGAGTAPTLTL